MYISDYKEVPREKFFDEIGMTYGSFKGKQKETALNSDAIDKILSIYDDIDANWLITGKGDMIKKEIYLGNNSSVGNMNNAHSTSENSIVGSNISGNTVKVSISNNDISNIIELHKDLAESLKASQNQINTLLEILKNK